MRLLLREYVSMLKESGELDALMPELLSSMALQPLSKPQQGGRRPWPPWRSGSVQTRSSAVPGKSPHRTMSAGTEPAIQKGFQANRFPCPDG